MSSAGTCLTHAYVRQHAALCATHIGYDCSTCMQMYVHFYQCRNTYIYIHIFTLSIKSWNTQFISPLLAHCWEAMFHFRGTYIHNIYICVFFNKQSWSPDGSEKWEKGIVLHPLVAHALICIFLYSMAAYSVPDFFSCSVAAFGVACQYMY